LFEPTDARYAEIGREMLASGDWLVPRLNGVTHLDKPPITYWASAAGMRLLGVNEWGARMGAALAGAFLFWAAWRIARRVSDASPERADGDSLEVSLAPLLLASSALAFVLARLLATDIFLAAAVAGFWAAWFAGAERRGLAMYVALGLGFLAKGPVVFVHTLLPLFIAALARRDRSLLRGLGRPVGWMLFALIAVPWFVIVAERTPGLLSWLLHRELWLRYTSTIHNRPGPPWYFIATLVAGALPWTIAAVEGIARAARGPAPAPQDPTRAQRASDAALVSWAIVPVLFFSFSGSKLPAYVLPELTAVAILAARALAGGHTWSRWGTALLLAGLAASIELAAPGALARGIGAVYAGTLPLPSLAHVAAALFAAGAIAAALRRPRAAAIAALVAWYGLLGAARTIEGSLGSPVAMARTLERTRRPNEPIVELGAFSAALPFYMGRTIPMLDVSREGAFEAPGSEPHAFLSEAALEDLVRRSGRVWVYGPRERAAREADTLSVRYELVARTRTRELGLLETMPSDSNSPAGP